MLPPPAGAFVSGGWKEGEGVEGDGGARLEGWPPPPSRDPFSGRAGGSDLRARGCPGAGDLSIPAPRSAGALWGGLGAGWVLSSSLLPGWRGSTPGMVSGLSCAPAGSGWRGREPWGRGRVGDARGPRRMGSKRGVDTERVNEPSRDGAPHQGRHQQLAGLQPPRLGAAPALGQVGDTRCHHAWQWGPDGLSS